MGVVVTLTASSPGDLLSIKGLVERIIIEPRQLQEVTRKFWGVLGESRISGKAGGRTIMAQVTIFDDATEGPLFGTARALADYIDYTLNTDAIDSNGTLTLVSESDHSPFADCTFKGAAIDPDAPPMHDECGTMGGGYFATVMLEFRQHSMGAAEEEDP